MDIKNVLVPTDFSVPSKAAVNYGVALARKFRARLTLLHVLAPRPMLSEAAALDPGLEEGLGQDALQHLSELVVPEDQDDLDLRTVIKVDAIHKAIISTIKEQHVDLVVLGTHGHGRLGRWVLGSTTEAVLRKLSIPTLTVRDTRQMNFGRILFATDLSESSLQALDFALDLADTLRSDIVALHTVNRRTLASVDDAVGGEMRELAIRQARQKLAVIVAEGRHRGIEVSTMLTEGNAAEKILKSAEEVGADLVLIGMTSKGVIERTLIGATAERVVREARVPVLCVPAKVPAVPQAIRRTS
jgi:nucleotide-binding universal stress UspA family protein